MNSEHTLDKKQLRTAFERAASSYDQAAVLQREVSNRMLSRLEYIKYRPDVILDAGSGTGYGCRVPGDIPRRRNAKLFRRWK